MFHMRTLSNTRSTPVVFSSKPTKTRWDHKQRTSIYLRADVCVSRDCASTANHNSSTPTTKPPKTSIKPSHRRRRPSIDKTQVSKPFPILTHGDRDLFDVIASGDVQTRVRGIPKAAEKKVKINAPELTKSSPQPKPKVPADAPPQSWYTPVQSSTKGALQRSVSNATPRTTPSKVDAERTNSAKELRSHPRTGSETRRDGVEPKKRYVHKHSISHPDCPWVESKDDPYAHAEYLSQYQPVRSATRGSYESDETVVEDGSPTRADAKKEGEDLPLVKSVQDTLRPTVRLISKPLPDLPTFDSLSSRWSASTGSVYSSDDPFQYDKILNMFPEPPKDIPDMSHLDDWENSNSLSTPPVFMSWPNSSSSSVATITPTVTPDPFPVKPLTLKAVQKPKVANVVHQAPRASYSYTQLQDSLAIRGGRPYPQPSVKGSIHTSIQTTGTARTLRRRSSSVTPTRSRPQRQKAVNLQALLFPWRIQTPEETREIERASRQSKEEYERMKEEERKALEFARDFGLNLNHKGSRKWL